MPYPNRPVRSRNKLDLLERIRSTPGGISRAKLARELGLSRAAVTAIVNDFLRLGLIHETRKGPARGGRRPQMLAINPHWGAVVGVDMGVTHLTVVVADVTARVLAEREIPWRIEDGPEACLETVQKQVQQAVEAAHIPPAHIRAYGVGVPGPVDQQAGAVKHPPVMPGGWDGFPIRERLSEVWGRPVLLNNDANLGAFGEWAYGAGRGADPVLYIKVGSGIGAGLVIHSQIYSGATGGAGEIGHLTIVENGPRCACGNRGCLEALAGGRAIARQAREAVHAQRPTQLALLGPPEALTAREVALAARRGDLVAQQILRQAGEHLGVAVAGLINLLNPAVVVFGGGVAQVGDLLLEPVRREVQRRSLPPLVQAARITAAVLGRHATAMGAVALAIIHATEAAVLGAEEAPSPP